jgi:predicted RNA-binding Zn ribbon-like protein
MSPYSIGLAVRCQQMMSAYMEHRTAIALDLVNTFDPFFDDPESLHEPADLSRFLAERGITVAGSLDQGDVAAAWALRDRLRAIFAVKSTADAASILNDLLAEARVTPRLSVSEDGLWQMELAVESITTPVMRLTIEAALGLGAALERYGLDRLRLCASDPCQEAFVDTSRNASRRFCSDRCANRFNVAAFRERQRAR